MLRLSTKDTYEREEDEAERLVRPAPKIKPSRHDRKRETIHSEPGEGEDKDRSLNRKDVGGSVRVLTRFLEGAKGDGKVKVVRKDTGETTYVKPKTLKEKSDEYALPEEGAEEAWGEEDHAHHEKGKKLWDSATEDPELKSIFKDLLNPSSQGAGYLARSTPDFPAGPILRGRPLPEGVTTLGQLLKALEKGQKNPPKPKEEPKPESPEAGSSGEETPPEAPPEDKSEPEEVEKPSSPESEKEAPKEKEPPKKEAPKSPKGKIPEPKRRKPEDWELMASRSAILETLPRGEMRDRLIDAQLHPDDVGEILATYHTSRMGDVGPRGAEKLISEAQRWFQDDPTKIPPPKMGKDHAGEEKPFEELLPDEQAETAAQHRNRTIALSLATHDRVTRALNKHLGAPPALADFLSAFLLKQKPPKEGEPADPEEDAEKSKGLAKKIYEKVVAEGREEKITPNAVKSVLEFTKNDPTAQRAAVAYFQARDYQTARERYLNPESPSHISEHQGPTDIARGIVEGSRLLVDRSRLYPPTAITQDPAGAFRNRVLQHVQTLNPEKYPHVRKHVDMYERQLFDAESSRHEKVVERVLGRYQKDVQKVLDKHDKIVEKLRSKHEETLDQYKEESKVYDKEYRKYIKEKIRHQKLVQKTLQDAQEEGYRASPTEGLPEAPKPPTPPKPPLDLDLPDLPELPPEPTLPDPPAKPARYGLVDDDLEEERERLWEEQKRQASSYSRGMTMGSTEKLAVYWGVEPYPPGQEGFAPYPKWTQVHARDLDEKDESAILKAAREWLRAPVLSKSIEGIERDTQLRAALDLAIRDHEEGRYSVGLHPQLYNQLLARLAGKSEEETLLTVRNAAVDSDTKLKELGWEKLDGSGLAKFRQMTKQDWYSNIYAKKYGRKTVFCREHGYFTLYVFEGGKEYQESDVGFSTLDHFARQLIQEATSPQKTASPKHDSVYVRTGEKPMNASVQIRKFASDIATTHPEVAYDLVGLADHVAQDEQQDQAQQSQEQQKQAGQVPPQFLEHMKGKGDKKDDDKDKGEQDKEQQKQAAAYRSLKASVLTAAKANPGIRNALMPVLQTIKQLG